MADHRAVAKRKPAARKPRAPRSARHEPQTFSLRSLSLVDPLGLFDSSLAGKPETAIRVTAILAVVRFLAQAVASMPGHCVRTLPSGRRDNAGDLPVAYVLGKRPNPWQSSYEFWEWVVYTTALYGNSFARIIPGPRGFCSELRPMHPTRIKVERLSDYSIRYSYFEADGRWKPLRQEEVLHVRWLSENGLVGMAPPELCATSIALARSIDSAATSYWENSARPDIVLETQETIPADAVAALRQQMRDLYGGPGKRGSAAVLPKKMTLKPIEGNTAEQSQLIELRNAVVADVARCWGVPSTLIGDSTMNKWSTVEQEHLSAQVWCLLPWQRRVEGAVDRTILSTYEEQGDRVSFKLDNRGLLRGDTASRVQLYSALWQQGAISPNEIRDLEDLPLLDTPAADQTYVQLGFSTLDNAAAAIPQPGAAAGQQPASPRSDSLPCSCGKKDVRNCGVGNGGFQPGNTCAKGGGGGGGDGGGGGGDGGGGSDGGGS
ncbi:MAG: phage portal protein, partial [Planctomycetia bacterium]|nr:phage portal protein [Planctomycetia bacterium]